MDSVDPKPEPDADLSERCPRCGYSLVGVPSRRCPECGAIAEETRLLRASDPEWLRLVVLGGDLIRYGAIVAIVAIFGGRWFFSALADMGLPIGSPRLFARATLFAALVAATVGAWLIVRPDPAEDDESDGTPFFRRRSTLRLGLGAVAVLFAIRIGLEPVLPPVAAAAISLALLGVGLSTLRGVGGVVARLVARCSDRSVEAAAKSAGRGGAWVFWVIAAIALAVGAPMLGGGGGGIVALATTIERLILSLGVIGTVICLFSIAKPMKAIRAERDCGSGT